jgi:hypothetical protein
VKEQDYISLVTDLLIEVIDTEIRKEKEDITALDVLYDN